MNKKLLKQIILAFWFILFLELSFWYLKTLLFQEAEVQVYLISFLIFFLFSIIFSVFLALSRTSLKIQVPIYLLVIGSILFWFGTSGYVIAGGLIFTVFLFFSQKNSQEEGKNLLKFQFLRISREGYSTFLTGAAILLAILLFMSPKIFGGEMILPRSLFDLAWPVLESAYSAQFPGFSGKMTVDQFIILQTSGNIEEILEKYMQPQTEDRSSAPSLPFIGDPIEIEYKKALEKELQKQLEEAKTDISEEMLREAREDFSESLQLDRKLKGDEKLKDLFYEVANNLIVRSLRSGEMASPIVGTTGIIFAFFLLIKTIFILFNYLLLPISWLCFKALLKTRFFKIKTVQVKKEELVL